VDPGHVLVRLRDLQGRTAPDRQGDRPDEHRPGTALRAPESRPDGAVCFPQKLRRSVQVVSGDGPGPAFRRGDATTSTSSWARSTPSGRERREPHQRDAARRTREFPRGGDHHFFLAGRLDEARHYLEYLAKYYRDPNTGQIKPDYLKTVDEFVFARIDEIIDTQPSTIALIGSLLYRGYVALANGNSDEYATSIRNAASIYKRYQEGSVSSEMNRLRLPEFPSMRARALMGFLADAEMPLYLRAYVWRAEQREIKYYCYHFDMPGLLKALADECAEQNLDVKLSFPSRKTWPAG